jgi:hypothetical protein
MLQAEAFVSQYPDDMALSSSAWTLHQQCEHLALTGRSTPILILSAHEGGDAPVLNANGELLFQLRAFPRGETQAPDFALPKGAKASKILQNFKRMRKGLEDLLPHLLDMETSEGRSEHPMLGGLTASQWWIFLDMHIRHHLSIITDGLEKG